ncbi:MAG TPA: chemotaxis protein CheX [candidate division Zixibacteria bacterium]|nr:chemotaxis protein CheX [candidate division Zixibacteria bacterium]
MNQELVIDKTIVSEFINAVKKVLNITAGEDVKDQVSYLEKSAEIPGEISATIDIEGDLRGKVAVSFARDYARTITSKIIGCDESELSEEDVEEGMGEIVNQVTGKVRTDLWNYGYRFNISIPEIINAPISQIQTYEIIPVHIIVFKANKSMFAVQINVQEKNIL